MKTFVVNLHVTFIRELTKYSFNFSMLSYKQKNDYFQSGLRMGILDLVTGLLRCPHAPSSFRSTRWYV